MARSNTGVLIGIAALVGGYFFLTRKASAAPAVQITSPGTSSVTPSAPQPVPGVAATTAGALTATNQIWQNLTPTTGPYSGYVNFPTGSQAAAGLLQWATDNQGNYYTQWAGHIYAVNVTQPDANGNYAVVATIS